MSRQSKNLLQDFLITIPRKPENTLKCVSSDLYLYYRELFQHPIDLSEKYASLIFSLVQFDQEQKTGKTLPNQALQFPKTKSTTIVPYRGGPAITFEDGRVSTELVPIQGERAILPEIRERDRNLVHVVFENHAKDLDFDFFDETLNIITVGGVFRHMQDKHGNSNNTLARRLSSLKRFGRFLEGQEMISKFHLHQIKVKTTDSQQPYLSQKEIGRILDNLDKPYDKNASKEDNYHIRDHSMFSTTYGSGLRVSELVNLKIDDIDFKEREIRIEQTKGGNARYKPIARKSIPSLRRLIKYKNKVFNAKPGEEEYLFISRKGTRITREHVLKILKREAKKIGIKKNITTHSLRNTSATSILENGGRMVDAQRFLDHKNIATTEKYVGKSAVSSKKVVRKYHPLG